MLPGLLDAGIDCIEHGTGLTLDLVEQMAERRVALVPTVMQTEKFPGYAADGAEKFPAYSRRMTDLYERRREVILAAHEAGVAMYAGSDGGGVAKHGNLAGEILAMIDMGLPADYALGAASWRARAWLGWNARLDVGNPADFVVYPRNPLEDPSVLDGQLTLAQIEGMSRRDLRLLRNTIYARHGRPFQSPILQRYFADKAWYSANSAFKESQLTRMRPGDKVKISVDAYPKLDLRGHVDSVQLGSGSRFSAFPAENATGNFVKIVQRVPVKIVIDSGVDDTRPLPLGLSVTPTVTVE